MKIKDIESVCWICGRTKEELENPFEDVPFIIPLYDLKDQEVYSGYHICGVCESIILTIGGYSDEYIETHINEKLDDLKEELVQKLINTIRSL